MDELIRKRLSPAELENFDRYDRRAMIAGNFVVWPAIAGLISYSGSRYASAIVCLVIVLAAFPVMIMMGKRARRLRELAESRYVAIMGHGNPHDQDQAKDQPRPNP